jgi:DNA polymerase-3 subunit epsilon
LAGHNPSIDKYMVRELFNRCNLNMDDYISYRMIDTMSLIWGLYAIEKLPIEACSSNGAFEYFNIKVEKRHHALDDCMATVKLYDKLIKLME